jgi:5-methylcytosine-specific restriction endonuclease McrA
MLVSAPTMRAWTNDEDATLRRTYPTAPWADVLAALPGRGRVSVYKRAHRLGIQREIVELTDEERAKRSSRARTGDVRRGKHRHPVVVRDGVDGKVCRACGDWKPLAKFGRKPDMAGGVRAICTTCEGREHYVKYRDTCIATVRRYQQRHPEKRRLHKQASEKKRHGRIMRGPGVTTAQLRQLLKNYGGKCAYCETADATTFDHMLPLCRGGLHDVLNLVPACAPCNFAKHDKTPAEWYTQRALRRL